MADISKITLPSGSTYNIKDETARNAIANLNSFDYVVCTTAANTPKDVTWDNVTGTLVASASTMHKIYLVPSANGTKDIYDEYITINTTGTTYVWEMFGNTDVHLSDLGALAYKDSASGSFTPSGTVSQPTFSGTSKSVSVTGTPSGSVSTPTVSVELNTASKYVAESATGGGSVSAGSAAACTLPTLSMTVSNETLSMTWSAGSFTPNTPTAVTLPTFAVQTMATGLKSATASQPTFTGNSLTSTGTYKPEGTVSKPTFSGTAGTVSVS